MLSGVVTVACWDAVGIRPARIGTAYAVQSFLLPRFYSLACKQLYYIVVNLICQYPSLLQPILTLADSLSALAFGLGNGYPVFLTQPSTQRGPQYSAGCSMMLLPQTPI